MRLSNDLTMSDEVGKAIAAAAARALGPLGFAGRDDHVHGPLIVGGGC